MPKHIGIVGTSPEGTALCYREIFRHASRVQGDHGHPTVTLHNEPLEHYVQAVLKDDWHTVGELLVRSARFLALAGAEFCIIPDNLLQHGVHLAEGRTSVPWLTMTELVAEAVVNDGRSVVGLIGTRLVTLGSTYQTPLGLKGVKVLIPEPDEVEAVDAIIFRELVYGVVRPESQRRMIDVLQRLKDRGCEGVILGVSEAPLLINEANSPLPVYDPSDLLAAGAVQCSLGRRPLKGVACP